MMKLLAWAAFVVAVIAGAGLAATNAGMVQVLVAIGLVVVLVIDIAKDSTPNQYATGVAIALPSLLIGMNGTVAASIGGGLTRLWTWSGGHFGSWFGTSLIGAAIIAGAVSLLIAQRTMPRAGSGAHR
jgi:hypothetical protein